MEEHEGTTHRIGEAILEYGADPEIEILPHHEVTRMSTKNQITLPVVMVRHLGLVPGDELDLWLEQDHIVLEKRLYGEELHKRLAGSISDPAWSTKEKIDAWVRAERDSWDRPWDNDN